ncbi:MAG: shikimate dehydrogenase [Bacteroidales bacterium]
MGEVPSEKGESHPVSRLFGLVGYPLGHSFSRTYFGKKFERESITGCTYANFELPDIGLLPGIIEKNPTLEGLNVTIPYKQSVIRMIDHLDPVSKEVGAVNTIRIERGSGRTILKGFNTDVAGFESSLTSLIGVQKPMALVLGTGGASRAVVYVLDKLQVPFTRVSREPTFRTLSYNQLDDSIIRNHHLIINCTPLGSWPNVGGCPPIPYEGIGEGHFLFDLVYNPEMTTFLSRGSARGALIRNGWEMLVGQAEAAWRIWNG